MTEKHFTLIATASHVTIMREACLRMMPTPWIPDGKIGRTWVLDDLVDWPEPTRQPG